MLLGHQRIIKPGCTEATVSVRVSPLIGRCDHRSRVHSRGLKWTQGCCCRRKQQYVSACLGTLPISISNEHPMLMMAEALSRLGNHHYQPSFWVGYKQESPNHWDKSLDTFIFKKLRRWSFVEKQVLKSWRTVLEVNLKYNQDLKAWDESTGAIVE